MSSSSVEAKFLYGGVLLHTLTLEQPKHKIHLISQEVKFAYPRQTNVGVWNARVEKLLFN